jgi:hypothetical protein
LVSNYTRLGVSGHDLSYSYGNQQLLKTMGAYIGRIQWTERTFLPTGQAALPVPERLFKARPVVDPLGKDTKDDDPLFARSKKNDAGTVAHHAEPISETVLDAVIGHIQDGFARRHGAALPVAIQKVRGRDDLPPA